MARYTTLRWDSVNVEIAPDPGRAVAQHDPGRVCEGNAAEMRRGGPMCPPYSGRGRKNNAVEMDVVRAMMRTEGTATHRAVNQCANKNKIIIEMIRKTVYPAVMSDIGFIAIGAGKLADTLVVCAIGNIDWTAVCNRVANVASSRRQG